VIGPLHEFKSTDNPLSFSSVFSHLPSSNHLALLCSAIPSIDMIPTTIRPWVSKPSPAQHTDRVTIQSLDNQVHKVFLLLPVLRCAHPGRGVEPLIRRADCPTYAVELHMSFSSCVDMRRFTRTTRGNSSPKLASCPRTGTFQGGCPPFCTHAQHRRSGWSYLADCLSIESEEDLRILRRTSCCA